MIFRFFVDYNSFNEKTFFRMMESLSIKSGKPYFAYIGNFEGEILSSPIPFRVNLPKNDNPFELLVYSNKANRTKCFNRLYGKINSTIDYLEHTHPSVKKTFSLHIVADFFK